MLLEFRVSNFKSFKDEIVFSMKPAPKIKDLSYSVIMKKVGGKNYRGLSSAVIYGPNAAGKTNIIEAMEVLRNIILRGKVSNDRENSQNNKIYNRMELIPNIYNLTESPVKFMIKFIHEERLMEYKLDISFGLFADVDFKREIIYESFSADGKPLFERDGQVRVFKIGNDDINPGASDNQLMEMNNNIASDELFMSTFFKVLHSSKLVGIMTDWIENYFTIFTQSNRLMLSPEFPEDAEKNRLLIDPSYSEAAKLFGIGGAEIGYVKKDKGPEKSTCYSMISRSADNRNVAIPSSIFESYGTQRFINIFPVILHALKNGGVLVIDEFDASIHPIALINIINIFHNDEINVNGAQLIFNTHNPIFLNNNLFRRDEIKFVEKDDETGYSIQYSLSDFGTTGKKGVRNSTDYMKNYFISQYGAIKDIDFSEIIIEAMKVSDDKEL